MKNESDWLELIRQQRQVGQIAQSIDTCREAISSGLDNARLYAQLAHSLKLIGQRKEARHAYEKALLLDPDYAFTYRSYGAMLATIPQAYPKAELILHKGLALAPDDVGMWTSLGNVYSQTGRMDQALMCYQKAQTIQPNDPLPAVAYLFALNYLPDTTTEQIYVQAKKIGTLLQNQVSKPYEHALFNCSEKYLSRPSKLKIGFVSPDLHNHPVGYFLDNVLQFLDKDHFEWYAFSNRDQDDITRRSLKCSFNSWVDVGFLNNAEVAQRIHEQGIHILIDLAGYTSHGLIGAFAYRPAPVQINWLGWFATTGLTAMDYLLTDAYSTRAMEAYFTEQLVELPHTRLCMTPPTAESVMELPAKNNGFITFGCVQNLAKINDEWLQLWGDILRAIPTARLRIQNKQFKQATQRAQFLKRVEQLGVPIERMQLLPPSERESYLKSLSEIDILLDTYPYTGGTTTAEALWMGVPTLTRAGQTMIARQGGSLLHTAGLDEWITHSDQAYIEQAIEWSQRLDELAQLRKNLRKRVAQSPLFDAQRFARDFELCLNGLWDRYVQSQKDKEPLR